jgi:hypothetical protein
LRAFVSRKVLFSRAGEGIRNRRSQEGGESRATPSIFAGSGDLPGDTTRYGDTPRNTALGNWGETSPTVARWANRGRKVAPPPVWSAPGRERYQSEASRRSALRIDGADLARDRLPRGSAVAGNLRRVRPWRSRPATSRPDVDRNRQLSREGLGALTKAASTGMASVADDIRALVPRLR